MSAPAGHAGTREAAEALGCSQSKILEMYHARKLAGTRGTQPIRARVYIQVDTNGRPLDPSGSPVSGNPPIARLVAIEERLEVVEASIGDRSVNSSDVERLKDATLLLQRVIERLQAEENCELTDAAKEQEA